MNDYIILSDRSMVSLAKVVNRFIKAGYIPAGGVTVAEYAGTIFIQAVYKLKEV